MGPNEYILSESNHTRFVLAPLILELPSTFCLPSNWLTSKLVPVPNQWIGPQPSMDAFWLAASPPARGAPLSRPRFKKSAQFALIRHRPAADLDRPSGSDTTTEEPTTDLASARAACLLVVVSGGRGISREPGGRSSAEEVTVLAGYERVAMSDALFAHLHLPTQYGEKNVPSDNELRENERNQRRRRPISRCSCEVIFTSYFPEGALKRHHRRRRRERPRYLLITGRQESAPLLGGERARMQVG